MLGRRIALISLLALLAMPAAAQAAFPGQNGKIAFTSANQIWTMQPDGSGRTQLTSPPPGFRDGAPSWSPDGSRVLFDRLDCRSGTSCNSYSIRVVNADGTSDTQVIATGQTPSWSPTGTRLVYTVQSQTSNCGQIYTAKADGTGQAVFSTFCDETTDCCLGAPSWSPDGRTIAYQWQTWEEVPDPNCVPSEPQFCEFDYGPPMLVPTGDRGAAPNWSPDSEEIAYQVTAWFTQGGPIAARRADGFAPARQLTSSQDSEPAWSPDGTEIAFVRAGSIYVISAADGSGVTLLGAGFQPDWQPVPVDTPSTYARPKGATPLRVSLVPTYQACTTPNKTHGAPLAFPSCNPPLAQLNSGITIGVGDGDPLAAKSIGSVRFDLVPGAPGPPDDSDVHIRFSLTNVWNRSNSTDYTDQLTASVPIRLTDTNGTSAATTQDFPFAFNVQCQATADTTVGGACQLTTTADSVLPGSAPEGNRSIWAFDQVRVYERRFGVRFGLFAAQGVFVP